MTPAHSHSTPRRAPRSTSGGKEAHARVVGRLVLIVFAAVAVLAVTANAGASADDHYRVKLTRSGQAAAKAASIVRSDLGTQANWQGGPRPAHPGEPITCGKDYHYHPKVSDITLNGWATSRFEVKHLAVISSEAQVFDSAADVLLDERRSLVGLVPCLRAEIRREFAARAIVSARAIPFPRVTPEEHAYRIVMLLGPKKYRFADDEIWLARGRTEVLVQVFAPLVYMRSLRGGEVGLARLIASRMRV